MSLFDPIDYRRPGLPVHHQITELAQTWFYLTISSSVIPFSSCLQSFLASGSFPMSQFFELGCQSIGASVSASFLPVNIQDWFPLGFTGWSPCSPRDSRVFSDTTFKSVNTLVLSFLCSPALTSILTPEKTIPLTRWTFVGKVMSLLFIMLSSLSLGSVKTVLFHHNLF